jgi:hypothetical protein
MAKYFALLGNASNGIGGLSIYPTTMTKIDERRHVPLCDRLIDLLMPVRRESGPVINLKKPEDETARLQRVTGNPMASQRTAPFILFLPGCDYWRYSVGVYRVWEFGANDQVVLLGC